MSFNTAVIGAGGMGKEHIAAALASEYTNKVYICDPSEAICKARKSEYGVESRSWEEILRDPEIKFLSVATPNEFHAALTLQALQAGKAVLCEKPMGMNLTEARDLLIASQAPGAFLQIGFELHYSTMFTLARKWIDDGLLGDITQTQCRYFCCEFHKKNTWRSNSPGSFLIGEKLSHYLDLQRWFIGDNFESVYSLSAPLTVPYYKHRDNHQIMVRYPGGKVGILNFIMYIAETYHEDPLREMIDKQSDDGHYLQYYICGLKGAVEIDIFRRRIRRWEFSDGVDSLESRIAETIVFPKEKDLEAAHNVFGQTLEVIKLAATGQKPGVSAADAYETMKLCFAAELSENSGMIISCNDPRLSGSDLQ